MKLGPVVLSLSLATLAAPHAFAAAARFEPVPSTSDPIPGPGYSSSADLPDAPSFAAASHTGYEGAMTHMRLATTPFSAFALGLKVGAEGIGFEVATPLATKINLRASASFLNYSPTVTEDGIPINGKLTFRTISAGADLYPYRNSFHITPGITMYNGNHASATTNIAGGSMFTVNDAQYQSSAADPVHGTFVVDFGRKFAPSLTALIGRRAWWPGHPR